MWNEIELESTNGFIGAVMQISRTLSQFPVRFGLYGRKVGIFGCRGDVYIDESFALSQRLLRPLTCDDLINRIVSAR